jgi:intracellular sulfur oxidation DsrE/DsrF family protein
MSSENLRQARRSFLSRLGAGAAAFGGAAFGAGALPAQAQSSPAAVAGGWQPARHAEDDWFDRVPAQHRFFFDTTTPAALGSALFFANNYFTASRTGYGLADSDLAVVICVRHRSTPFAYSDAMWAKYGVPIAERAGFLDPRTNQAPTINAYQAAGYGGLLPNNGITLDAMIKRGVRLAVCQISTRGYATTIAGKTGGSVDDIYKELTEHLVPNSHLVPAGIVAVNRAQERGYSFAYVD